MGRPPFPHRAAAFLRHWRPASLEIPLSNVSQCTTGKNEVTLEFHQGDDAEVSPHGGALLRAAHPGGRCGPVEGEAFRGAERAPIDFAASSQRP